MGDQGYTIARASASEVDLVMPQWKALYEHEQACGMPDMLRPNAPQIWRDDMARRLEGRHAFLLIAKDGSGAVAGFHAGMIRRAPNFYQTGMIGAVTEIYVAPEHRGRGLARSLIAAGCRFFQEQGVDAVEVVTVQGNAESQRFWHAIGWVPALMHYRARLGQSQPERAS